MARKKLTSLLDSAAVDETTEAQLTETAAPEAPAPAASAPEAPAPAAEKPAAATALFEDLVRKECRFRDDQLEDLSRSARRLQRTRLAPGPRITDNTLIRVAVDLLMSRADELQGSTEAELRASLGLTE
ncbi:hypothetical protein [Curtobacterium sp. PhB136]|uniref:hypothetical protein n=1 Tax=Curtobacterium sp. PhB136 TaxID=2485181 RepID=UPI0010F0FE73|nr:hypothetical protein [Curtobacterium sp. PhB136]TCK58308.1 hypothetical protein EDF27_3920 [Curtobacterium sp. PhB136]